MSTKINTNGHPVQDVKPSVINVSPSSENPQQHKATGIFAVPENTTAGWITNRVASSINTETFRGFTHGRLPGFRIKEFLNPLEAEKIAKEIQQYIEEYKTAPGVGKAGETLVEYPKAFDTYAELAAILRDPNISIPYRLEMADKIIGYLTRHVDSQFKPLRKGDIELFWGLFRQINKGAGWHLDDVTKDSSEFNDRQPLFQGSVVLHIKTPNTGGETILADRKAQNDDEKFLNADGWTYDESMLDNVAKTEVPAVAGDLVFLSTHNYHKVNPCLEVGAERISFSMFFVIFVDEPNIIYYYN